MKKELKYEAEILDGVEAKLKGKTLFVKGVKGEDSRTFHYPGVEIKIEDNKVVLYCKRATKKEKSMMGVFLAHVNNMIKGVKESFVYKLKVCSGHFPMNIEIKNENVIIHNFLGEKKQRLARLRKGVSASINGDIITVEGYNKEATGQSGANIENATRISKRDRRIFQDGIFLIDKGGRIIE